MDKKKLLKYSDLSVENGTYDPSLNHDLSRNRQRTNVTYGKRQFNNAGVNGTNGSTPSERRKGKFKQANTTIIETENYDNQRIRYENGVAVELRDEDGFYRPLHEPPYSSENRNSDLEWPHTRKSYRGCSSKYVISIFILASCFMLYIVAYNQTDSSHGSVAGWSYNTSRNTRNYVFPDNVTILNQPKLNCKPDKKSNAGANVLSINDTNFSDSNEIFLLVIICSSTNNFEARDAIRNTWGNQSNYEILSRKFDNITKYFANTNVTDKLSTDFIDFNNFSLSDKRVKRDLTDMEDYLDNHYVESESLDFDGAALADSLQSYVGANGSELFSKILDFNYNEDNRNGHSNSNLSQPAAISDRLSSNISILNINKTHVQNDNLNLVETNYPRNRRDVHFINNEMAKNNIYLKNHVNAEETPETADDPRFDHGENKIDPSQADNVDADNKAFSNFDENDQKDVNFDYYDYQTEVSNIMRIPPRGQKISDADSIKNADDAKNLIKLTINGEKLKLEYNNELKSEFAKTVEHDLKVEPKMYVPQTPPVKIKFLYLLGQSSNGNNTELQSRIDEEAALHGDIIQESFIDSYNNLTLKSVMLLKWVETNCGNNVRYIMKTDDDMFINVPRLINALQNKTKEHFRKFTTPPSKYSENIDKLTADQRREIIKAEKLLMGDLICDARPISDTSSKWYSPTYMYGGRIYPRYLSGTGYVMSYGAAEALYKAALDTPLFHLEDIYVTGMCSQKAGITPVDNPGFSYSVRKFELCTFAYLITAHQVSPIQLQRMHGMLMRSTSQLADCEVKRILAMRNTSLIANMKNVLFPILGSPKSFINGLVGLGFANEKIAKMGTVKKRKKANNGCF